MKSNFVKPSKSFIRMAGLLAVLSTVFQPDMLAESNIADDALLAASNYAGQEIIVSASRVEELKKDATASVTVISREEIEMSPAEDLGDLLAEKSIGHIQKYPGTLTAVGIRGFRSDTHGNDLRGKILVLIDGRRAATGNLAKLMTDNVERIEIIRGPAAVQYGSAAIGGVVNVITRQGKGEFQGFVEQEIGTHSFSKSTVGLSGKAGSFDYSAAGSIASRDDYKTGSDDRYDNTGYDGDFRGSLNLGYELAPGHRLGVIYTHFDVDKSETPNILSNNDLDNYKEPTNRSVDFSYTGKTSDDRFAWMARYVLGQDQDVYFDPVESNASGWDDGIPYKKTTDQNAAQAQVSYLTEALSVTAGMDWLKYDLKQNAYTPRESAYEDAGFFMLAKGKLLDNRLILTAGLRYDDYDLSFTRDAATPETSQSSDSFVKSFGAAYQITDNVKLRTSYGEGFQMPDAQSLAADFIVSGTRYVGNPDLKPESSRTIDGGIEVVYGDLMSSLTLFTTEYEDFIQQYDSGVNEKSWRNQDSATVTGLEGEISYRFPLTLAGARLFLEPYAAGTYMFDYKAHYDDGRPDETIQYLPEWNLSAGLKVRDENGFSGNLNVAFFGDTKVNDYSKVGNPVVTKGGFWIANLSLAKKIALGETGKTSLTVKGGIENLFDRDYEFVMGYPMPGRAVNMGVRLDF
ncbi:MAG: TonB-dependent receptor [Chlorobiaceae bacterium]|nr:TonB-dependent receptor [Chlorobiaceae bacterium]